MERQRESIDIAKEGGKYKGRKPIEEMKLQQVQTLIQGGTSVSKAVIEVGIGRRTYYKAIERPNLVSFFFGDIEESAKANPASGPRLYIAPRRAYQDLLAQ